MSCWALPKLYLNHWHASIKSHPACELLGTPQALFESLICLHKNSIQLVSCWALPKLYLNHWHASMKSYPGCELLGTFQALFESLTCLHEIPSSVWVAGHFPSSIWILTCHHEIPSSLWVAGHSPSSIWITDMPTWNPIQRVSCWALPSSIWITDMPPWNPIQNVSCWALPKLYLNHWHASIKSHSGCELLGTSQALFESLTCVHEIPSRLWVAMHFPSSIWITDMPPWNSIQGVSCYALPKLYLNHWHASMKFHPGCELLGTSQALFESLTCVHEIPFRVWVAGHFIGSIWITDMPLWNPIQHVSCWALHRLYLNYWHVFMKSHPACELLCTFWVPSNHWHVFMKCYPACEFLCTFWVPSIIDMSS